MPPRDAIRQHHAWMMAALRDNLATFHLLRADGQQNGRGAGGGRRSGRGGEAEERRIGVNRNRATTPRAQHRGGWPGPCAVRGGMRREGPERRLLPEGRDAKWTAKSCIESCRLAPRPTRRTADGGTAPGLPRCSADGAWRWRMVGTCGRRPVHSGGGVTAPVRRTRGRLSIFRSYWWGSPGL